MTAAVLLALALGAAPDLAPAAPRDPPAAVAARGPLRQEEWDTPSYDDDERERRLFLSVWGGNGWDAGGTGHAYGNVAAEVDWAFSQLDLGVAGYGWRDLSPDRTWTRVGLLRATERFKMRSGVEAAFGLGVGAAVAKGWEAWFQVALGVRVPLGPLFLGGELSFDRGDLLRLAGGLGVAF